MIAFDLSIGSLKEIECKEHSLESISGHTFVSVVNDKSKKFPNFDLHSESHHDFAIKPQ